MITEIRYLLCIRYTWDTPYTYRYKLHPNCTNNNQSLKREEYQRRTVDNHTTTTERPKESNNKTILKAVALAVGGQSTRVEKLQTKKFHTGLVRREPARSRRASRTPFAAPRDGGDSRGILKRD